MVEKLGWYEMRLEEGKNAIEFCLFSKQWRKNPGTHDTYFPDVSVKYRGIENNGETEWFISQMYITNPTISEFNELAMEFLKRFKEVDPKDIGELIQRLEEFMDVGVPTFN